MGARKSGTVLGGSLVLAAALLWGTVGPAQVLASSSMSPAALGGWRLLSGGLILGAVTARPRMLRVLTARTVVRPLLACAVSTGVYQATFLSSVDRTGAALATVIALGTAPAATGLCARWIAGERLAPTWAAGTVAAVAGCGFLLMPGDSRVDPLGLLFALAAGICYGVYTVSGKQLADAAPVTDLPTLSAISLLAGSLPVLPWMIKDIAVVNNIATLALIAWLGVVTTAAAYGLFAAGLSRVRATTVGTLSLAEPLAAALIGVLLLHEHLSRWALAGSALILVGMTTACLPPQALQRRSRQHQRLDRQHVP